MRLAELEIMDSTSLKIASLMGVFYEVNLVVAISKYNQKVDINTPNKFKYTRLF